MKPEQAAKALRRWRLDQDFSQAEVCWRIPMDASRYSALERGIHRPSLALAVRIWELTGSIRPEFWINPSPAVGRTVPRLDGGKRAHLPGYTRRPLTTD